MADKKGISIVLAGEAGQGIQSIEVILVNVMKKAGYNVFATKEYMSRVRGGVNSTQIIISCGPVAAPLERMDIFVPLTKESLERFKNRITEKTLVLGEKDKLGDDRVVNIPFQKIGSEFGNALYSSSVAVGLICGIIGLDKAVLDEDIKERFAKKGEDIVKNNIGAAGSGFDVGRTLVDEKIAVFENIDCGERKDELLLDGHNAVAIGAIAGGCDAVFAYPMTPGTGVFAAMAGYAHKAGIALEQVEDEIGVINMAIGAWYAGARALVTTSGGGFALMTEGISLSGMTETPVVVHLAQRPGPATGLPTRTEQGDLNLARYAGHGVFPRKIYSPGTTKQAFMIAAKAFNDADKYQIPVFILTDQYFTDTYYNVPEFELEGIKIEKSITETGDDYKRYALAEDGISPRGVPGCGKGRVCVDSDEHDETGRITEDLDGISLKMKEKRLKKFEAARQDALAPEVIGDEDYETLFVCWGSVYHPIKEALEINGGEKAAALHFSQVYPLHPDTEKYLKKAKKVIAVENNQDAQFAELIRAETGFEIKERILKYNGLPFASDELAEKIRGL